jgi:hypothetical protein
VAYSTQLCLLLTSLLTPSPKQGEDSSASPPAEPGLADVAQAALQPVLDLVEAFRQLPVTPARTHEFEQHLQGRLREVGRRLTQHAYNHLEPADANELPKHVRFQAGPYTRTNRKTPQHVWTLFGQIRLLRTSYRPTHADGDPTIFPLASALGLTHGASPALADRAARLMAGAGTCQRRVLQRLKQDHGVGWGVKKLRQVTAAVAFELAGHRQEAQVEQLLGWLKAASAGTGRHKPVLSVGRDGITLPLRRQGRRVYEVASTGTISVMDRRGKRLGTVYLAHVPEALQPTLGKELTGVLTEVLRRWQGPMPRLAYVTDAGDNETSYHEDVLRGMKHPRTAEVLEWIRVVDYYHASQRVWAMGEALFGKGRAAWCWSRKMLEWLLKPGGVNRVLHSAAAYLSKHSLPSRRLDEYIKAHGYLRERMGHMRYFECRRVGVPIGSGVTEAGCKTVYTQRLKLSGMHWKAPGAQVILNLRVVELSGVWDQAFQAALASREQPQIRGSTTFRQDRTPTPA